MIYFVLLLVTTYIPVNSTVYNLAKYHKNWNMLPITNCGKVKLTSRIVGGDVASVGQFPWISRLAYASRFRNRIQFNCAGSLINEIFVLTAAHCVTFRLRKRLRFIRLGENFSDVEIDCDDDGTCAPIPQDIGVNEIIVHERFNVITNKNDIALVSLAKKVKCNAFVLPICLPRASLLHKSFTLKGYVEVAGWGETNSWKSYFPSKLRYAALPVQRLETCTRINMRPHDGSQFCVGERKGKDSCNGDSGGPMMKAIALNGPPRYFLFGIISQGTIVCGQEPAIYTSIPYYMKWILDNLKDAN